jgi:hypothetical protein
VAVPVNRGSPSFVTASASIALSSKSLKQWIDEAVPSVPADKKMQTLQYFENEGITTILGLQELQGFITPQYMQTNFNGLLKLVEMNKLMKAIAECKV